MGIRDWGSSQEGSMEKVVSECWVTSGSSERLVEEQEMAVDHSISEMQGLKS